MKRKLSVTLDENLLKIIDEIVETGRFRNKSHFVEYSLNVIINDEKVNLNNNKKMKIGGENE